MAESEPLVSHNQSIPPHKLEHYENLFKAEATFMANPGYLQDKKAKTLRAYSISCIEDYSKSENFDALVPHLAMIYFDRLISRHKIEKLLKNEKENEDLFVICCLTIAWKMRTKSFKLPTFLETQKKEYKVMEVMRMELYILNQLEWRIRSLTPICFADYFMEFLMPQEKQNSVTCRIVKELIITAQADINITRYRPSLIAAYAVSAIASKLFPQHLPSFEAALLRSSRYARMLPQELSTYKEALENICKDMVENLVPSSESTSISNEEAPAAPAAASSSTESPSSSPLPPAGKRSDPIQIGGDSPGTPSTVQRTLSETLLEASVPPGTSAEDRRAGKRPMVEEPEEDEIQPAERPKTETLTEDLQLDFPLKWGKYQEAVSPQNSCVTGLCAFWAKITAQFSRN